MGIERFAERQAVVLNAATRLREIVVLPETDILRDAAIQRFELTFELVLKALHSYLQHQGFQSAGPRPAFKTPFVIGLMLN
ncbi:MAG: nucleotidyltransferase substrate binding protein [Verrucomicrobia bacterium]|nr:nucleotidyltransferase substrate binding protein [Verrucomicrobiota bacterium]